MNTPELYDRAGILCKGLGCHFDQHRDIVLIMAGTNDVGVFEPPQRIMDHLQQLHGECHRRGIKTVALAPTTREDPTYRAGRDSVTSLLHQWSHMNSYVIAFADVEDLVPRSWGALWDADGLHLASDGSRALGHCIA